MKPKRSQKLKILDRLCKSGYVTNRIAMEAMQINNPFERIRELREYIQINDFFVKSKSGSRFKIFYTDRAKAVRYIKRNGFTLA